MKLNSLATAPINRSTMRIFRQFIYSVAISASIAACSSTPVHLYDGAEKTKQELALLWLDFYPHIVFVDANSYNTLFDVNQQYYVQPGNKTISFKLSKEGYCSPGTTYYDGKNSSYMPGTCNREFTESPKIPLQLEAGHTYLVTGYNFSYDALTSGHFSVKVKDLGSEFSVPPPGVKQYEDARAKAEDTGKTLYDDSASRSFWNLE